MRRLLYLLIFIFLTGFMVTGKKWYGLNPTIKFGVNPNFVGFQTELSPKDFAVMISWAAHEWNTKADSRIKWVVDEVFPASSKTSSYFNFADIQKKADESEKTFCEIAVANADHAKVVFSVNSDEESDCSGRSCSYVWSCGDRIVHADVEFNNSSFVWSKLNSDLSVVNLKSEAMKVFGYISGLTNCGFGLTASECNSLGSEPTANSALYKFPEPGKIETINDDDVNGIQTIYGKSILPFDSSGIYSLTLDEQTKVNSYYALLQSLNLNNELGRIQLGSHLKTLADYNKYRTNKEQKEQYDSFYEGALRDTARMSIEQLQVQRDLFLIALVTASQMKEDALYGRNNLDPAFIDYTIQKHLDLWRITINRLGGNR